MEECTGAMKNDVSKITDVTVWNISEGTGKVSNELDSANDPVKYISLVMGNTENELGENSGIESVLNPGYREEKVGVGSCVVLTEAPVAGCRKLVVSITDQIGLNDSEDMVSYERLDSDIISVKTNLLVMGNVKTELASKGIL